MGKPSPPSHLFIARHGYRLDTADKNWHFTSAEPYNPPLTYGGFTQTRNLGSRIASIVHSRPKTGKRAREVRFVIHTSPYVRCLQTSVAIAEGIAQYCHQHNTNARFPGNSGASPAAVDTSPVHFQKPLLRVEAWLGEWLTPDYFSDISPPPGSRVMVASAIGDLARTSSLFSASALPITPLSTSPLDTLPQIASSLPGLTTKPLQQPYTQLQPTWAVGSREPIPRGFVSHAKSYAEIDFGYDSFRFGDGGEYGEEWSTMQKRFRNGLAKMLEWYKTEDGEITARSTTFGGKKVRETGGNPSPPLSDGGDSEEEEEGPETIVIMVTHGGGCNAMLGAITDQPALTDVPIASLTMGVLAPQQPTIQRPETPSIQLQTTTSSTPIYLTRNTPAPLPLKYNLQLTNSTTHLRRQSDSQPPSRSSSTSIRTTPISSSSTAPIIPPPSTFTIQSSGLLTRSASSSSTRSYLWTKIEPLTLNEEACDDDEDEGGFGGNLGDFGKREREKEREREREREREKERVKLKEREMAGNVLGEEKGGVGLWGRPKA